MQNDKHATAAANDGGSISGSVAARTAIVDDNNDEDDNMELLQKRLVTLQNEVAIMQKKVEGARHKVDLIKKNGVITAATADSKNIAGKGSGVVSVTSRYVFLLNCFPIDEKKERFL